MNGSTTETLHQTALLFLTTSVFDRHYHTFVLSPRTGWRLKTKNIRRAVLFISHHFRARRKVSKICTQPSNKAANLSTDRYTEPFHYSSSFVLNGLNFTHPRHYLAATLKAGLPFFRKYGINLTPSVKTGVLSTHTSAAPFRPSE